MPARPLGGLLDQRGPFGQDGLIFQEALEIVELLWNDQAIQDEINIYQVKVWPNRQLAEKLQGLHASSLWTAERVEQALRKMRTAVERHRLQSGLDRTDFEALLAKLGRRFETDLNTDKCDGAPGVIAFRLKN